MIKFLYENATTITVIIAIFASVQPWIVWLWKRFFRNPTIEIYPSGNLEIGYSDWGPTLGINGTLRAEHGDMFVKSIRIRIKRVSTNEEHWFEWVAFRSPVIIFNPKEAPPMEMPSSFIVSQLQAHRYNIVFFDSIIQGEIRPLLEKLNQRVFSVNNIAMLSSSSRMALGWQDIYKQCHDEYSQTKEFTEAYDRLKRSCYWQAGRYELELHIDSNKKNSQLVKRLAFQLRDEDVEKLCLNGIVMTENPFRIMAGEQIWNYNFAYPVFEQLN